MSTRHTYHNLTVPKLIEHSLLRREGILSSIGALAVNTGKYTGRSPEDRFIVDEPAVRDKIDWGKTNKPFNEHNFQALYKKLTEFMKQRDNFVFDGFVGAEAEYRLKVRVEIGRASCRERV